MKLNKKVNQVTVKVDSVLRSVLDSMNDNIDRAAYLNQTFIENNLPKDLQEVIIKWFLVVYAN